MSFPSFGHNMYKKLELFVYDDQSSNSIKKTRHTFANRHLIFLHYSNLCVDQSVVVTYTLGR